MKIGMNMLLWGTHISSEHIPIFEGLAEAGFDGVEIPVNQQRPEEIRNMAHALDSLGMGRTASAFVTPEANPISPEPASRRAAVDALNASIDRAVTLGADKLVGGIYQAHKYFSGQAPSSTEWQWAVECLTASATYAQERGLSLSIEFLNRFEAYLLNTSSACKQLVEDIGVANVGVHYDTHHANIEEPNVAEAISELGDHLTHVHLSESHRGTLGSGQVDWVATFDALKRSGYDQWLTIEAFGTADPELARAANVWRNAFSSPEQLYTDGIEFIRAHLD